MRILVTGATGLVGSRVVAGLTDKAEVTALSRNAERARGRLPDRINVLEADLADPVTARAAFTGVDAVFLFCVPESAAAVARIAAEAGVQHVVVLSAASVTLGFDTHHHAVVEQAVKDSGVSWTMVRPGEFMANVLPIFGPMIKDDRKVRYPFGNDSVGAPIHEADIADVAVEALLDRRHAGAAYTLNGPREYSVAQQVASIGAALGEAVDYEEISREEARTVLHNLGGAAAENADLLLGFTDYDGSSPVSTGGEGDGGEGDISGFSEQDYSALMKPLPTYQEVTGRRGRDFTTWAHDHLAAFR